MGMATYIDHQDIEVVDKEGLEEFLKKARNGEYPSYKNNPQAIQYAKTIEYKDGGLNFYLFDEWKIISYWYDEFVMFLRDIAIFIEGQVVLEFENESEAGHILFENGECIITVGIMQYTKYSPEKLALKKDGTTIPPYEPELRKRLIARRL